MTPRKKQTKKTKSVEVKSESKPIGSNEINSVGRITRSKFKQNEIMQRDSSSSPLQVKKARKDQPKTAVLQSNEVDSSSKVTINNNRSEILNKIDMMYQEKYENVCERLSIITPIKCTVNKLECMKTHFKNNVSTYLFYFYQRFFS